MLIETCTTFRNERSEGYVFKKFLYCQWNRDFRHASDSTPLTAGHKPQVSRNRSCGQRLARLGQLCNGTGRPDESLWAGTARAKCGLVSNSKSQTRGRLSPRRCCKERAKAALCSRLRSGEEWVGRSD